MNTTLDSKRPSVVEGCDDDTSYRFGRDPSILAFGDHQMPSDKQNLVTPCEDAEVDSSDDNRLTAPNPTPIQTVEVFLLVKPLPENIKLIQDESDAYEIVNSTTLLTKLPSPDNTVCFLKGPQTAQPVRTEFTFIRSFGLESTLLELFEEVVQPRMANFLGGENCTVMTYGTTGSGKSHTLQGTATSPGIIPRGLEFVFSRINPRPMPWYKPIHSSNVVYLNAVKRAQEIEAKNRLLTFASIDKHHYINAYSQMQNILHEESPIRPSEACDAHYSIWVSFAEIYNENIYDLLSTDCQKRRPLLKLAADSHDRAVIKGLKTFCVNSGSEAYQIFMAGQYNLKVAATALNARSSRSHCIFTIHLLKYYDEDDPESVEMSTFTFCDLAGSERLKKTPNVGDRYKEAQNITTSCQRALSGKEQIALIVNLNALPSFNVQTQDILNLLATVKEMFVELTKMNRRMTNQGFSQMDAQSVRSNTDWNRTELCDADEISDATTKEQFTEITSKLKDLKDSQDLESKVQSDSLAKKTLEQRVSPRDCESQTNEIARIHGDNQTDAIVDLDQSIQTSFVAATEDDRCVQTVAVENEELTKKDKLLVELERKCSDLEVHCNEKQLSIKVHTDKIAEVFEMDDKQLEERMGEHSKETGQLKQRLQQADKRDEEKDTEIEMLQKSYKAHRAADLKDKKMHEEMIKTLKELLETKEALAHTNDLYQRLRVSSAKEIESLEARITSMEKHAKQLFEAIQQNALTNKAEAERLRTERNQLKAILSEKQLEMQLIAENRDKMITQYETLVKSLQDDCERSRKE